MKFRHRLILLLSATTVLAAEKAYLPPFGLTNVHTDYGDASTKLFGRYAEKDNRFEIVPARADDSLPDAPTRETIREKALSKGCSKFILGDLTRLGETVVVNVSLYDAHSGNIEWSDEMRANTPNDLDQILERMGKNVGTSRSASGDTDIYNVTQKETANLPKKRTERYFGMGIIGFLQLPDPGPLFGQGLEFFWLFDLRNMLLQLDYSIEYFNRDPMEYRDFQFGISAYYPFMDGNTTPFVGGGVSYGFYEAEGKMDDEDGYRGGETDETSGLFLRIGGGIFLNRTGNVNLRIRAEYQIATSKLLGNLIAGPRFVVELGI